MATKSQKKVANPLFSFVGKDGKRYNLTLRQREFCHRYLEFKGSGVDAVLEAGYRYKDRRAAAVEAARQLTKANICAYITLKLEEYGFNDDNVTKQHLFVINQFSNLVAKNKAIDMFYRRKNLYPPERVEISEFSKDTRTDAEIAAEVEELKKDVHK